MNGEAAYSTPVDALGSVLQVARTWYGPGDTKGGNRNVAVQLPSAAGVGVGVNTVPTTALVNGVPSMALPVPGGPIRAPDTAGVSLRQSAPETVTTVYGAPSAGVTVNGWPAWLDAGAADVATHASNAAIATAFSPARPPALDMPPSPSGRDQQAMSTRNEECRAVDCTA